MKKMIKQFRAPFKSNSPNMKKKVHHENHSNTNKICFTSTNNKKKNTTQVKNTIINKNATETGPVIKKVRLEVMQKKVVEEKKIEKKPSNLHK